MDVQLVNRVVEWERKLEIEGESQNIHQRELYAIQGAESQCRKGQKTILAKSFTVLKVDLGLLNSLSLKFSINLSTYTNKSS